MVENFPGFPGGVSGPDLVRRMREQALEAGAILIPEDVEVLDWVDQAKGPSSFMVRGSETSALARSVILATGARARRLGLPAEARGLWSAGISACATCDGAHGPFRGRELAVVGGGDSAAEEALFLTRYAARVHLLVRGSAMRASAPMRERVLAHPRVSVRLGAEVEDALSVEEAQAWGGERLQGDGAAKAPASRGALGGILVRSSGSGRRPGHSALLPVAGLFYAVGHDPNTALLRGRVRLNAQGYVTLTGADSPATSVPGLFAAGDVHDSEWRQAVTAAGAGCRAALAAERFLSHAGVAEEVGEALRARGEVQGEATEELEESGPALARSAPAFSLDDVLHQGEYALRRLYHESTCPILVLYTAPSCAPCRSLKPIIRKLAREYKNKVKLVLIDTEAEPHVAQAAEVTSTPTLQIFFNKDRVAHVSGVRPRKAYQALIDPLLNAVAVA